MHCGKRLRFPSSVGDWFDAPASVRLLTAMLFLQFIHTWLVVQSPMIFNTAAGWRALWIEREESPVTLAWTLTVVLGLWAVLLIVDGYVSAVNSRQRFRTTRVGLNVMLAVFFLVYAVIIYRSATSLADPNGDEAPSETVVLVDEISQPRGPERRDSDLLARPREEGIERRHPR
jgi:hypothetical protein